MSLLTDYLKACVDQPSLMASMSIPDVVIFCQLVFWLKDEISTATSSPIHHAPPHLPVNIHNFLMAALGLTDEIAKTAWEAFRGMAWEFYTGLNRQEVEHRTEPLIRLFLEYGLPHDVERLALALRARNVIMAGPGQEMWNHACDLCCWVQPDDEGQMRAVRSVVTDGVTLGHPCCAVHDCKEPIRNTKGARYCMTHVTREKECAVVSCSAPVEDGFTTCTIAAHRALEAFKRLENKAMFQLKHRLDRIRTSQPSSGTSLSTTSSTLQQLELEAQAALLPSLDDPPVGSDELEDDQLEAEIMDAAAECEGKSSDGNVRIRAQFGRRRTHNEELCVASCGIILGRATFYGSEAVNGVLLFWRQLFPTQRALPNVLWHDQNCRLWSMLMNSDAETRQFFDGVALPVDVFHFKCKHKETDIVCGTHCNPYIWPELHTSDGRWRFNSSSAEQINNWFSKYQAIVREMNVDRYNFFLDEMIKRRNRMMVKELERKGARPYSIPREELLCE
ncbi:hypothetical protein EVJ58_g6411 [Rhodofomes roseus]|uniref:CxC6 like cysteine cluster associated with KDZ domain-containing protein n=1 Tax=Rhodofomes roseus TaxID=34475 RepID=A0A4Y9Y8F2_9APHY|nr:hypothetical protein EVJ58_g6411 [Rhodofomes roseus]